MLEANTNEATDAQEYVAFKVSEQEFCVDIMSVREIRGWTDATSLPHAPHYVLGVTNLRGSVLPIVDLASRLGLPAPEPSARHVIIVTKIGSQIVGLLVDAVIDILTIMGERIQPTPDVASETVKAFIRGVVSIDGRMIRLLDLERVLPQPTHQAA